MLEIKDAVEGTRSATSLSSMGPDIAHSPSPASASPVLHRLGSGSRPSPYSNVNNSNSTICVATPFPADIITVRTSFEDSSQYAKFTRSPAEETPGSAFATPMTLQPAFGQPRPSIDAIEPLDDTATVMEYLPRPTLPITSRPRSDTDPRLMPNRLPAQVTIETMEFPHKTPNIQPRQSSIGFSAHALRPNINVPPPVTPRSSSKDYSNTYGLNVLSVPQSGKGMSPISPPSPGGQSRNQEALAATSALKNGPSLNERRNNPSVPHIQTQSLVGANGTNGTNGVRHPYEAEPGLNYPTLHSDATVVGGTLGFGRRPSHKRNHSSADVIQYQPIPATTPPKASHRHRVGYIAESVINIHYSPIFFLSLGL